MLSYKTLNHLAITSDELSEWAASRETSEIVALAIHAIADQSRTPESIWECPTQAEWDHVVMAIENYIDNDICPRESIYFWGMESIQI